jgi:hypothetical protein
MFKRFAMARAMADKDNTHRLEILDKTPRLHGNKAASTRS